MLTSRILLIYAALTMAGCAQQRLTTKEYLVNGLEACQAAMDAIKNHPNHKELRSMVKHNFKNYKMTKRTASRNEPEAIIQYSEKITECETTVNAFLNKKQIERKRKAAKKRVDLLRKSELKKEQFEKRAKKYGYKGVNNAGISYIIDELINRPNLIGTSINYIFKLTRSDQMFKVSQIFETGVIYRVDTSAAPYDLERVIFPYAKSLSETLVILPKIKGKHYFIGQKIGATFNENYVVFAGVKEIKTTVGNDTAFIFKPAFN